MMSLTRRNTPRLAAIAVLAWGLPGWAHHSHGNYDLRQYIDMEGTVTEVHWINPHTWIYMEVVDEGGIATIWTLEGGGINALTRRGWAEDSVQVGDNVSVRCHPLRAGTPVCLFGFLRTEDGYENEFD